MIVSRSPLRISFSGGGSDLPSYYKEEFGRCITTSIDKYVYVAIHETFNKGYRLAYSNFEFVQNQEEILHPVLRETIAYFKSEPRLEIGSYADVPGSGTGLGSSSAFTSALVYGLSLQGGQNLSASDIARIACEIEIEKCGDPIGKQDQYATAYGGFKDFRFLPDNTVQSESINVSDKIRKKIDDSIVLLYLGRGRSSSSVLKEQHENILTDMVTRSYISEIKNLTTAARTAIECADMDALGEVVRRSWVIKSKLASGISDEFIDSEIIKARICGSLGEKIVGAGGGGFMLCIVKADERNDFIEKMAHLRNLNFKTSKFGTQIIFTDIEE
jgi:D-glycero-alpha-D-manno-heptose-7-phosphate kinase